MYQHPGVYIEEIPSGSRPIEAASTSTALIIGYATKGPPSTPTLLFSFDQYVTQFGGIADFHDASSRPDPNYTVDYMGHTVQAFFNNGGTKAYIVRLAVDSSPSEPLTKASARLVVPGAAPSQVVVLSAADPGAWANGLVIRSTPSGGANARYTVAIGRVDRQNNFVPSEVYTDVSLDPTQVQDFIGTKIKGVSALIASDPAPALAAVSANDTDPFAVGSLTSGDLSALTPAAIAALNTKGFDVALDGGLDIPVTLSATASTPLASLADVAAQIETQVKGGVTTNPRRDFTCTVQGSKLALRSGTRGATSAVAVTAGAAGSDVSGTLKLVAPDAVPQTGAAAAAISFPATFATSSSATFAGGANGGLPAQSDYQALVPELKKLRDISIILLPGQTRSSTNVIASGIIDVFVAHAEQMKNRMVIIDPADGPPFFNSSLDFLSQGFPTSTYTATYYPWLEVANPYYHPELRPDRDRTVFIPPSGFAAGVWAKTDGRRGVWKAPAGLQASLTGAANTKTKIGDDEQDQFNPVGLNCFRRIISDIVIWGSRTLATKADPEWRYVPVRRTAMMLEESIYQGIQWAVFEPNDHRLWSSLRLNIGGFMDTLFRAGAFQGEKASDAYFVRCGLGDTMTQAEIDAGQVIVIVGFAPLKPAEFVIVRIQQIVGKP